MTPLLAVETAVNPVIHTLVSQGLEVLLGVLTLTVMPALLALLRAKASESSASRVALVFAEAAASAVAQVDRELKPKLLAALADGVLTDDEKTALKEEAMKILRGTIAPELWEQAKKHFGPLLEQWIAGLIERAVTERRLKLAAVAKVEAVDSVKTVDDAVKVLGGP